MVHFRILLISLACLATTFVVTAIKQGQHVGGFENRNNKVTLFGHKRYPYMVLVKITVIKHGEPETAECGGIIIGVNTVLTAGHCLYQKLNPTGSVHAGIVHRYYEAGAGQKLEMKDYRVHERYRKECKVGKRCCYEVNDIGIVWTEMQFEFGPSVQIATLAKIQEKPSNKEGWIVGWGLNSNNEKPAILQRGQVKVLSSQQCRKFDPQFYITENVLCLKGVNTDVVVSFGDSGSPFTIDGIVYGMCSLRMNSAKGCQNKELSVYTFIPNYKTWIDRIVSEGPSKQIGNKFKPKRDCKYKNCNTVPSYIK